MTHEELMKPRWKVIADFPGSDFPIGRIINSSDFTLRTIDGKDWLETRSFDGFHPNDFLHLFKPMKWWEERTEDELPKFIKYRKGPGRYAVHKVMKPYPTQHPEFPAFGENFVDVDYQEDSNQGKMNCEVGILTSLEMKSLRDFQPATEEEYNNR